MQSLSRPWGNMHYRTDGPVDGPVVVFANSLGTDLRLWDAVIARLPGIRAIRFDKRGHGLSDLSGPHRIEDLAADAAALIEAEAPGQRVVFVGLSVGGCIGQALAHARPDLLRGLVVSNSASKMGTDASWQARIDAITTAGIDSIADQVMERWFGPAFRAGPELPLWRNMLARTSAEGYIGTCRVLAACDLTAISPQLNLPVLVIAGDQDGSSPPDLVKATADLIPGAGYRLIPGAGHLPPVETPDLWATVFSDFLKDLPQ